MQIESSNNAKEKDLSQSLKIENNNMTCKDGFCKLPTQNPIASTSKNKVNLFDPI